MTRPSEAAAIEAQRTLLCETLQLAVPMWMRDLRDRDPEDLLAAATHDAATVGAHGDALQYGGKHCTEAFHALARGLAIAALLADGGVDFLGLHWCAIPHCRAGSRFDHVGDAGPEPPEQPPTRPVVTLPDVATWSP